jgi:hypothetical protein
MRLFALIPLLLMLSGRAHSQQSAEQPPPQPIPFSHKVHTNAGIKCLDCHPIRKPGFAAGLPREAACMGCHATIQSSSPAVQKLAAAAKARRPIPWIRIYQIPDYVWFSHEAHHKDAGISCETCHGPVAERDVLTKERPTSMAACMNCHAQRKAPNDCNFCHETR